MVQSIFWCREKRNQVHAGLKSRRAYAEENSGSLEGLPVSSNPEMRNNSSKKVLARFVEHIPCREIALSVPP